jgi:hypothetical protein
MEDFSEEEGADMSLRRGREVWSGIRAQPGLKATGVLVSACRPSALKKLGSGWISGCSA